MTDLEGFTSPNNKLTWRGKEKWGRKNFPEMFIYVCILLLSISVQKFGKKNVPFWYFVVVAAYENHRPPLTVNRPPRFPRHPPRIHPWFGLLTRRGTVGRPGVLEKSGRRWAIWPQGPHSGGPQCCPCWQASAGSVGWFSWATRHLLSSPPDPSWV